MWRLLTAYGAGLLVGAIAAAITSGAHNRCGAAQSIAAAMRAVCIGLIATGQQAARLNETHEEIRHRAGAAQMWWLIAAILAGDNRIAVLILGQALARLAAERVWRAAVSAAQLAIAAELILAVGTLLASVAECGAGNAASTALAAECLCGAGLVQSRIVGALLVRVVVAVGTSVAHKEPGDAHAAGAALNGEGREETQTKP